ncbi:MAG: aminotransferase class I/II-fold pyridoxal phosphate-dependent enzyme, partial [Fibrobacterales bacterium]|nr:aminotransferase class I/II-fold pyridoxal phosphate-dependent enzyme [Fibrobacterales bacterium]
MKVPFCQIARDQAPFEDELLAAAARVVRGGRWIGGPEVEALERELGAFAGREAVACASGTDALVLALKAAGVRPGDKVVVPAFSFVASA